MDGEGAETLTCVRCPAGTFNPADAVEFSLQSAYTVHMQKKLCVQSKVLTEISQIDDISFFQNFNVVEITRLIDDNSVRTDVEVYYSVSCRTVSRPRLHI